MNDARTKDDIGGSGSRRGSIEGGGGVGNAVRGTGCAARMVVIMVGGGRCIMVEMTVLEFAEAGNSEGGGEQAAHCNGCVKHGFRNWVNECG